MALNEIENYRQKLFEAAKDYGMNSSETVRCSQELDLLIIEQIKQQLKNHMPLQSAVN
ncbi:MULTISPECIES: aspartyl-phosphate phosphatase Spo0E family protein [Metabacillus]|uniref:Aspartyl-phosphate phosphatase Spo0E family protein n=1 Tax=Metabacillus hrfriensis TaxID=3048891 RepID=A0ACD4REF1_9BACI|nr:MULTISPECIES: aspartyl-phosphate phosphatase Spo0E family protein [Metabacillus]UAL53256.1 aspartyl-phosphate phosphatase Spo0E family protein [Metabacillus dongyingensis]UOK58795.1 aspartyl-phosphate phosphatase Spo0E family protein [Bacillus sp. OVS6]WHZ58818.1 aspartyl-phosphate phosphatase Spo0E family protein [Metabacillus sp. CT-WN-B3]